LKVQDIILHMPDERTYPLKPIKWYKDLADREHRKTAHAFLVEGERVIGQIIAIRPHAIKEILSTQEPSPIYSKYPQRQVTESQFKSFSTTQTPQSVAAVVRLPMDTYSSNLPDAAGNKILLLEDVQDPGNVGTLIRTAAAFGYSGAILTDKCADPFSPKCLQSTAGAVLSIWIRRTRNYLNLIDELKSSGHILVAMDLRGLDEISALQGREKILLALGNEAAGLSQSLLDTSDFRVRIPLIEEKAESLNVASCGAICMYLSCR
jgi:TrmH family RNA methyltransferase